MDNSKSFRVGIRRKIPYLTNFFLIILCICFLVIIIFDLIFYPVRNLPQELQAVLFFWLVPEFWKKVLIFSFLGFCSTCLMYVRLRFYKPALIWFNLNEIIIRGKAIRLSISLKKIKKIICNDAISIQGESKERLSISIEHGRKNVINIKLKNYSEADDFIEQIIKYENLNLQFYDFQDIPTNMNEE